MHANKDKIKNPDFIKSGINISIPSVSKKDDSQLIAKGHLLAYEEYKVIDDESALNHLYVAYKYDKDYVEKIASSLDNKDLLSVKKLFGK